jgi:hypothetical protein
MKIRFISEENFVVYIVQGCPTHGTWAACSSPVGFVLLTRVYFCSPKYVEMLFKKGGDFY